MHQKIAQGINKIDNCQFLSFNAPGTLFCIHNGISSILFGGLSYKFYSMMLPYLFCLMNEETA